MCIFGGAPKQQALPPPPPVTTEPPGIEGAAVEEGHAESLTDKQKTLRAGQATETNDSIIQ